MAEPAPPPDEPEFSDSDRQWFDRLSGRLTAADDPAALREADALRRALALERGGEPPEETAEERERQWQQLQFRLRREGLGGPRATPARRWWPAGAAVAAVLVLAVLLVPRGGDDEGTAYDPPPVLRGDAPALERAQAHPRRAAEALAAALREAGLMPLVYQDRRVYVVDVELPATPAPAQADALRRLGLEGRQGWVRVVMRPR